MTGAATSVDRTRSAPSWLLTAAGGASLLVLYVVVVTRFSPFLSGYGDDVAYVGTPGFIVSSYQPLWGTVAGAVFRAAGLHGVMVLQAGVYAIGVMLVMAACWRSSRPLAWGLGTFMVLDVQAMFYVASPLTETLSLALFALGMWAWQALGGARGPWRWLLLVVIAAAVVGVALTRAGDVVFGVALLMLTSIRVARRDVPAYRLALVALVPVVALTALWSWSLQGQPNATGLNLYRFVLISCRHTSCPVDAFTGADTPVTRDHVIATGGLAGLDGAFARARGSVWSPGFGQEMRTVYLRLLRTDPHAVAAGVLYNIADQARAATQPAYPEDPNGLLLASGWLRAADLATRALSVLLVLLSPVVAAYGAVRAAVVRRAPLLLVFALAWLVTEMATSQWLYAAILPSEAPRMRLHYVVPAVIVVGWVARDLLRLAARRRPRRAPRPARATMG